MSPAPKVSALDRALWGSDQSLATPLVVNALDHWGPGCLDWAAATAWLELRDELGAPPARAAFGRLMAGLAVLGSDSFYRSLPDFVALCLALAGEPPGVVAELEDCAWGMTEAMLLCPPPEGDPEPFSDEIRAYLGALLDREGIHQAPDVLRVALRDHGGLAARARYEFSDDPELFGAIEGVEADRTGAINAFIRERMGMLLRQLAGLDLAHGDARGVAQRLLRRLEEMGRDSPD